MKGQIVKIISNDYFVDSSDKEYICKARGIFKQNKETLKVGDYVSFDDDKKVIEKLFPRKNTLDRPFVSNVDVAFIVTSLKKPDFSTNLLDKLLVICSLNNIEPVICVTKKDLLKGSEYKKIKNILNYYKKIGYTIVYNTNISKIKRLIKNKVVVLTGQTGSGKSTLINKLDKTLDFETGEISEALGRGKHTTRHVSLVKISKGKVLDTPGFSAIDLDKYTDEEIRKSFVEFNKFSCKYKGCTHTKENNCSIKNNVPNKILESRYNNYLNFIERRNKK